MDRQGSVRRGQARGIIEAAVAASPGLSKTELRKATGLAWGTIWYHLQELERNDQVKLVPRAGHVHVFPAGIHERRMRWLAALRHDGAREVFALLANRRQLTIAETSRLLGRSPSTTRGLLEEFVEVGFVQEHGTGRPRFLACPQAIASAAESLTMPISALAAR